MHDGPPYQRVIARAAARAISGDRDRETPRSKLTQASPGADGIRPRPEMRSRYEAMFLSRDADGRVSTDSPTR